MAQLEPINAFNLNRLDNINNYKQITSTLGLDYKIKKDERELDFS